MFEKRLKLISQVFAIGGWILSIYFSANGFGFTAGGLYVVAGYFLGCLVTVFEVVLNNAGTKLPKTLSWICILAYIFGIGTNCLGIWQGRGGGTAPFDIALAIVLGIILEVYPEPLYLFAIGARSPDLIDTISTLLGRSRQGQQIVPPQYTSVRPMPIAHQRAQRHKQTQYQPPDNLHP